MSKYLLLFVALAAAYMWGAQDAHAEDIQYKLKEVNRTYRVACPDFTNASMYTDFLDTKEGVYVLRNPVDGNGDFLAYLAYVPMDKCVVFMF